MWVLLIGAVALFVQDVIDDVAFCVTVGIADTETEDARAVRALEAQVVAAVVGVETAVVPTAAVHGREQREPAFDPYTLLLQVPSKTGP